jgi:hypothetical protein
VAVGRFRPSPPTIKTMKRRMGNTPYNG